MRNIRELLYLGRDFFRYLIGKDYSRQTQGLGYYFQDERCYYNDLTKKADLTDRRRDGLPVLYSVAAKKDIVWPTSVLLFGLGSIDKHFLGAGGNYLGQVRLAAKWMLENLPPAGYFILDWNAINPNAEFYSYNSAMTQGLALSFATRVIRYELADRDVCDQLERLLEPMKSSMLAPLEQEGTVLRTDEGLFLLECCSKSRNVVLNGWIFGVFGLMDLLKFRRDPQLAALLDETLATMENVLPRFSLPNGWSYYDLHGRISSPCYHNLHIALLDAMHRLTGRAAFLKYMEAFRLSNNRFNRMRYTLVKIKDKLTDSSRYFTQQ